MKTVDFSENIAASDLKVSRLNIFICLLMTKGLGYKF